MHELLTLLYSQPILCSYVSGAHIFQPGTTKHALEVARGPNPSNNQASSLQLAESYIQKPGSYGTNMHPRKQHDHNSRISVSFLIFRILHYCLITVFWQIFTRVYQLKNFENQSQCGKDNARAWFFGTRCIMLHILMLYENSWSWS